MSLAANMQAALQPSLPIMENTIHLPAFTLKRTAGLAL